MSPDMRSFSSAGASPAEAKALTLKKFQELIELAQTMQQPAFVIALTDGAGPARAVTVVAGFGHPLHQFWCVDYLYRSAFRLAAQLRREIQRLQESRGEEEAQP